jgi:hypothetical protein
LTGSLFAWTRYAIEPSPWPSRPEVISIQVAVLAADQAHSRERLTATVPVPPAGPKLVGVP